MSFFEKKVSSNVIFADYPDPDIIRVENTYYMISTTMHFMPGAVILRSYNLKDWETASYVYNTLDSTEGQKLSDNKGIYGQGMWAASLRYHNKKFYVSFVANDTHKTYLYTSSSIEGPWQKSEIEGFYHDMSLLFDEIDGRQRVFAVSGNTNINLTELKEDLSGPDNNGVQKCIITDTDKVILGYEGSHIYKINGRYYIFFIHWPEGKFRTQACYVSDKIEGPYKGKDILCSDLGGWNSGVAQGGIVDTPDGRWYGMLFQDHGALGRIPVLVPVSFDTDDGFPVFGTVDSEKNQYIVPQTVSVPDLNPDYKYKPLWNDDFISDGKINLTWQWNHNPDLSLISLTENEYRITTDSCVKNPLLCKNTITQRPVGHNFSACVEVDFSFLNEGDFAGLCALEGDYGFIAVHKKNGNFFVVNAKRKSEVQPYKIGSVDEDFPEITAEQPISSNKVILRCDFDFNYGKENAVFKYKEKQSDEYKKLGEGKKLRFTLDQFVGCRFSLFFYSTKVSGGTVSFSNVKRILEEK
ncbi:MAG: glycoside hydrolase 43 family protein [Treponema sp.]|nr:glycoside hydrolase 43 family protein [Treponema sp.]